MELTIRAGGAAYRLDTSFMTALRYRAARGGSFLRHVAGEDRAKALVDLVYAAMDPKERPVYLEYLRLTQNDISLQHAGLTLYERVWGYDKSIEGAPKGGKDEAERDEFHMLASWGAARLPECALSVVSASQASGILYIHSRMAGGKGDVRRMDDKEQLSYYGVDAAAVKRALARVN